MDPLSSAFFQCPGVGVAGDAESPGWTGTAVETTPVGIGLGLTYEPTKTSLSGVSGFGTGPSELAVSSLVCSKKIEPLSWLLVDGTSGAHARISVPSVMVESEQPDMTPLTQFMSGENER